ncbi:MAG: carbon storage regulator [Clostridia bacterium]|jgi:carbon storage regulator|nr:carbon storage regulator [Clostridia bacterium]
MLVLSRSKNESIMIGDDIKITVVEVRPDGTVRLGIEAPKNVEIYREEVYKAIQEENKLAAQMPIDFPSISELFKK